MKARFEIPHCETCEPWLNTVFGDLKKDELKTLSLHKGCNFYKPGQVVFYEGSYPAGLYCMNRGKVKVYKTGEDGKEQIVRLAKEGDILGYRALISGEPYSASAAILEDATMCFIPRETFFDFLKNSSSFSMRVMQLLTHDLAQAEKRQLSLAQKPVRERVAEALLVLKEFYGLEEDKITVRGAVTRKDIADIAGTATETAIRLLSEFKDDKIIDIDRKRIKILDHHALVKTAHVFD